MRTEDVYLSDAELSRRPQELSRYFNNEDEASFWSKRLSTSGYPAKRRGRCVWFSTEHLQTAAVEMAARFGFEEFFNSWES